MSNEMTIALFHSELGIQNDDYLAHFGISGMHWGIRRYQPYGEGGYDPKRLGRNIGEAAKLAATSAYQKISEKSQPHLNRFKTTARSMGSKAASSVSEGLDRLNEANDRLGERIRKATDSVKPEIARRADLFRGLAQERITALDKKATEFGYEALSNERLVSLFNSTLGKSDAVKRAAASLGATLALKTGTETASKRMRGEGPQSSLGGKALNFRVLGDSTRHRTLEDQELYGKTEYEKFLERQSMPLSKIGKNSLADRQASWQGAAGHAKINDWFETFSRSPELSKALGIDKERHDAMEKGVKLSYLDGDRYSKIPHQQRLKELAEGRKALNSPSFIESGDVQDLYGYKFLTSSQRAKLQEINQTPVARAVPVGASEANKKLASSVLIRLDEQRRNYNVSPNGAWKQKPKQTKSFVEMVRGSEAAQRDAFRKTYDALNQEKQQKKRVGYNVSSGKGYGRGGVIGISQKKLDSLRGIQEYSRKWNSDFNAGKHPEGPHPYKDLSPKDWELVNRYVYWGTAGRSTKFDPGRKTAKGKYHQETIKAIARDAATKAGRDFIEQYMK